MRFTLAGRAGRRKMLTIAEVATPIMETPMMKRVTCGKLYESKERLKSPEPIMAGSQPKAKIMMELVAQEWKPSRVWNDQYHFLARDIRGFLRKPSSMYGMFSAPQPQRRCCLYKLFKVPQNVEVTLASMDTGYSSGTTRKSPS